jgi:hypothetical protein
MLVFENPLYEAMNPAFIGLFVFIGALFGSFFNVLSQRWGSAQIAQNDEQSLFWLKLRGATTNFTPLSDKGVCSGRSVSQHPCTQLALAARAQCLLPKTDCPALPGV